MLNIYGNKTQQYEEKSVMQNRVLQNQDIKINHASTVSVLKELFKLTDKDQPFEVIEKRREDIDYQAFATLPENLHVMFKSSADTYGDADFIVFNNFLRFAFSDLHPVTDHNHPLGKGHNASHHVLD